MWSSLFIASVLMSSSLNCDFQIESSDREATLKIQENTVKLPILSRDAQLISCQPHERYKDLVLVEVMIGEAGTTQINQIFKLFVIQKTKEGLKIAKDYPIARKAKENQGANTDYRDTVQVIKENSEIKIKVKQSP